MRATVLLTLAAVGLGATECTQIGPRGNGRVEVSAFSAGKPIEKPAIDLIEPGTGRSLRSLLRGGVAADLAYGRYIVRVSAPGFSVTEREFRLEQPTVSVRVQLPVAIECGGYSELVGTVEPQPKGLDLWVRLVPLMGVGGSEAPVSPQGYFLISGLDAGQYLLLFTSGGSVVHTETVQVYGSVRLKVKLEPGK